MTFKEIIQVNCRNHSAVRWWPHYAYHYTDVENAVNILRTGCLYSRVEANRLKLMKNDNASRQVIDMTNSGATACVRFYYRPLTPTQYHNEGFKHPQARYNSDLYANVPVPVFFVFDLPQLLSMDNSYFSEMSQAGVGARLCKKPEEFARFNFKGIYGHGYMDNSDVEKKFRQAEILYMGAFPINSCLQAICCRNNVERITLLNLLRSVDLEKYNMYKDKIWIVRDDMFICNGLFVTDCDYYDGTASIIFSNSCEKKRYTDKYKIVEQLRFLNIRVEFDWMGSGELLNRQYSEFPIDYENPKMITFRGLIEEKGAAVLYIKIYVEDKLMCFMNHQLSDAALF